MLNYLRFSTPCDTVFGLFLVVWFLTRHVSYFLVCRSIVVDVPTRMSIGCYNSNTGKLVSTEGGNSVLANVLQPFNDPDGLVCYNHAIEYGFLALLLALQVLLLIWFGMVLRVAYGVLTGKSASDSRSDDEGDEDEDECLEDDDFAAEKKQQHLGGDDVELAKNVALDIKSEQAWKNGGVPASMAKERRSESPVTSAAGASISSSSSSRPRRSGRTSAISLPGQKELLGRIGCDKPT
jgi:very-long-chain ceramide synthase